MIYLKNFFQTPNYLLMTHFYFLLSMTDTSTSEMVSDLKVNMQNFWRKNVLTFIEINNLEKPFLVMKRKRYFTLH